MTSPRNWTIGFIDPSSIYNCKTKMRDVPSYTIVPNVESISNVFKELYLGDAAIMGHTSQDVTVHDHNDTESIIQYQVTITFHDWADAADLATERANIIERITDWCGLSEVPLARGYRVFAIKRPKFATVTDVFATSFSPCVRVVNISCLALIGNMNWYSGRRVDCNGSLDRIDVEETILQSKFGDFGKVSVNLQRIK